MHWLYSISLNPFHQIRKSGICHCLSRIKLVKSTTVKIYILSDKNYQAYDFSEYNNKHGENLCTDSIFHFFPIYLPKSELSEILQTDSIISLYRFFSLQF